MSLNQYKPAYILEAPRNAEVDKANSNKNLKSKNSVTLEVQLRTVDAKNNLHARNPSTKAPDIGLMVASTSREVFRDKELPAGLNRTGDKVS